MRRVPEVHQLRYPGYMWNEGHTLGIVITSRSHVVLVLTTDEGPAIPEKPV